MAKPKRRILKAEITHISLVPKGANRVPVLYKSEDKSVLFDTIIKDDRLDEHGELTAIVYAPEAVDAHGDVASAEVIKQAAYDFSRRGLGSVDVQHDLKSLPKEKVWVAESFIVQKGDERFSALKDYNGNPVDTAGAWAVVIKIDDPQIRKLYREGGWNGVSMFGSGLVKEEPDDDGLIRKFLKSIASLASGTQQNADDQTGDIDMTKDELQQLLAKQQEETIKQVKSLLAKEEPKDDQQDKSKDKDKPKEAKAPIFKGDPTDDKAVKQFEHDVKRHAIMQKMDATDPESVREASAALAELKKEFGETKEKPAPSNQPSSKDAPLFKSEDDKELARKHTLLRMMEANPAGLTKEATEQLASLRKELKGV